MQGHGCLAASGEAAREPDGGVDGRNAVWGGGGDRLGGKVPSGVYRGYEAAIPAVRGWVLGRFLWRRRRGDWFGVRRLLLSVLSSQLSEVLRGHGPSHCLDQLLGDLQLGTHADPAAAAGAGGVNNRGVLEGSDGGVGVPGERGPLRGRVVSGGAGEGPLPPVGGVRPGVQLYSPPGGRGRGDLSGASPGAGLGTSAPTARPD